MRRIFFIVVHRRTVRICVCVNQCCPGIDYLETIVGSICFDDNFQLQLDNTASKRHIHTDTPYKIYGHSQTRLFLITLHDDRQTDFERRSYHTVIIYTSRIVSLNDNVLFVFWFFFLFRSVKRPYHCSVLIFHIFFVSVYSPAWSITLLYRFFFILVFRAYSSVHSHQ